MNPYEYLNLLEQKNITPNWWCSDEYFKKAGLKIHYQTCRSSVVVADGEQQMFPAIYLDPTNLNWPNDERGFWADFPERIGSEFLDYEYIYDPKDFLNMKGKSWSVFRKNSRKFLKRIEEPIRYTFAANSYDEIETLIDSWAEHLDGIEDAETLVNFAFDGENVKGIVGDSGHLYGINIYDENFKYVNFRYSISENIPFLAEYMRLLFYQDIEYKNKLVNDGGIVGNVSLQAFKNKMNPVQIRSVKGINI